MGYGGKQAIRSGDIRRFNFTGNGSNTAFDLGFTPSTQNQLIVTVNGLVQHYDAFSVTGSTLTFTGTPASGDAIQVTAVVDAVGVAAIPDGAIANVSTLAVTSTSAFTGAATFSNNVGLGTDTPNKSSSNKAVTLNVPLGQYGAYELSTGDVGRWYINADATNVYDTCLSNTNHTFYTGGSERARIDSTGNYLIGTTAQSNNVTAQLTIKTNDYTKPAIQIMGSDNNWWGRMSHSVQGGTQGTFISSGGAWSVNGTTYSATKDYDGSFPTTAAFISSQWNSTQASSFAVLTKAGGSTKTDGTVSTLLGIDTSGRMTVPNQPAFSAYGTQSSLANNGTVVPGSVDCNIGSNYSTSTGRFTAPVAGTYYFIGTLDWNGATTGNWYGFQFKKNGASVGQGIWTNASTANDNSVTQAVILTLAAGDYVTMQASYQNTPSTTFSNYAGHLIG